MKTTQMLLASVIVAAMCVPAAWAQGRGGGACCAMQDDKSPACCGSPSTDSKACCAGDAAAVETQSKNRKSHRELMRDAHALVFNNDWIKREVEEIPGGVRTVTTTTDPDLLKVLKRHPKEMGEYYKDGGMVRGWDPVFRALAQYSDKVDMKVKELENGVEVTVTSEDDYVVELIRAHAKKVSDFVARGRAAMHEPTPLPGTQQEGAEQ